jgi:hypothetical protein
MVAGMPVVAQPCPRATGIMVIVALTVTATRTSLSPRPSLRRRLSLRLLASGCYFVRHLYVGDAVPVTVALARSLRVLNLRLAVPSDSEPESKQGHACKDHCPSTGPRGTGTGT